MKAVLMAGGEGSRLKPLTLNRPKPLVPVMNKPIMEHILGHIKSHGIEEVLVTLYYLGDEIQSRFGDGSKHGVKLTYSVEETPLGTAGAVKMLEKHLDSTFVIMSGDSMTDIDISAAVRFHKKSGSMATIVLTQVDTPLEYGVVIIDEKGRIVRFLEKPGWGEVFSDTVNTGMYIFEPEVLKMMEPDKNYDWSKDIFPALLEQGKPIFGAAQPGYWCDIGNLKQYREVHEDALNGKTGTKLPGKQIKKGVWVGEDTEISPAAKIEGPVVIGKNCKIKSGAVIGEYSVIGNNCIIEEKSRIANSIVWNNAYIGKKAHITGCTICRNTALGEDTHVEDGAIVGDSCVLGKGARVRTQIKIWPEKNIPSGANVNMNIIYAQNWPATLFSALGVRRVGNIEYTPEFGARLGAAYGASLKKGATVIVSRSPHKMARVIKRSMVAGLMSLGVKVIDIRSAPLPIARHIVRTSGADGGVHTRTSPYMPEMVLSEFFDKDGINISTDAERKIESIFSREDYRRTDMNDVGVLEYDTRYFENYLNDFYKFINVDAIRARAFKIVIDYSNGSLAKMLPPVLGRLGCDAVSVNAYMDPGIDPKPSASDPDALAKLSKIVRSLKADLGVLVDGEAEKLSLIDNKGRPVAGPRLLAMMLHLIHATSKKPVIATQITSPNLIRDTVKYLGGKVVLTQANSRALMTTTSKNPGIIFSGDIKGGYIFPGFQPAFDALVSMSKILEHIAIHNVSIADLNDGIPEVFMHGDMLGCTWEIKGKLMRMLVEKYKNREIDMTDGVRLELSKDSWVIFRPDPTEPLVHIISEGKSQEHARDIVKKHKAVLTDIIAQ